MILGLSFLQGSLGTSFYITLLGVPAPRERS